MKYRISGVPKDKIPKEKAATKGYKIFGSDSLEELAEYINSHAVVPCRLAGGYRKRDNVEEIYPLFRLDVDKDGEAKRIDRSLKRHGVTFIKKPSTNHSTHPYKFHYFIPIENVSQNYDEYKLQYHKFLADMSIELSDKSLASVVQNSNPYKGTKEDAKEKTKIVKGTIYHAPTQTAPAPKERIEKHSDTSKKEVKKMLNKIDPDCSYSEWLQVGLALYDWCPKKGYKLYDKWSKQSDKYDGSTKDKWADFEKNSTGKVTLGTLVHMAYGDKSVDPLTLFKPEKGSVGREAVKVSKEEKKKKKKAFNLLDIEGRLTAEIREKQANEVILFEGLIAEGYHTVLYGNAGTNKTTISAWACVDILKKFPEKKVHFWAFDSDRVHNASIDDYIQQEGVNERFALLTQKGADYFHDYYNEARENEYDLRDLVIVIDTFKFITADVNSKSANKKVLHEIKKLQTLGASILTLSHSNKDGATFSGTAELSQDSDALMVIARDVNESTGEITTTIKTDTRCRFGVPEGGITLISNGGKDESGKSCRGGEFHMNVLNNMRVSEGVIDVFAKNKELELERKETERKAKKKIEDTPTIDKIKEIIKFIETELHESVNAKQGTIVSELVKKYGKKGHSEKKIRDILDAYSDDEWKWKSVENKNGGRRLKVYKLLKKEKQLKKVA